MRREGKQSRKEGGGKQEGREGKGRTERKTGTRTRWTLSLPSLRNIAEGLRMSGSYITIVLPWSPGKTEWKRQ